MKPNAMAMKIANRLAFFTGSEPKNYLKRAWAIVNLEEEMDFFEFCRIYHNQPDLLDDSDYVLRCAEGDNPTSWVDNEVDRWGDYCRAFEKGDMKAVRSFIDDIGYFL